MSMLNVVIDQKPVTVPAGATILDAARAAGIEIPTLCLVPGLPHYTSCFLCVVEVEGLRSLQPSCSTAAAEGMKVTTHSDRITRSRKLCLELLASEHAGDCYGHCHITCPAGIEIPQFISAIASGDLPTAMQVIGRDMPLPSSLGRVCTRPCEAACRRGQVDQPVAICSLKSVAGDGQLESRPLPAQAARTGKKVAVVGGGPAGVTAAYFLLQQGHDVTILEMQESAGGMLKWGIPAFRLPRELLDQEIATVTRLGARWEFNQKLGRDFTVAELKAKGYDAVFLGLGAQAASRAGIEGETTPGVLSGIDLLGRASRGEKVPLGELVMVVGGGNTAMDACRTALRLGSKVVLLYRRTRAEMPALPVEIEEAIHEGTEMRFLAAPVKIAPAADGKGLDVTCIKMELGAPDSSGRRRPVPVPGSEYVEHVSTLINAIGQQMDRSVMKGSDEVKLDKWGSIACDPRTGQTSVPWVFTGGDCAPGTREMIAVQAVAAGHRSALAIGQLLAGEPVVGEAHEWYSVIGKPGGPAPKFILDRMKPAERVRMPTIADDRRLQGFYEIELGLSPELGKREADRCMVCGCLAVDDCKLKRYGTEYRIEPERLAGAHRDFYFDDSHPKLILESGKCLLCGSCVRTCEQEGKDVLGFVGRGFATIVMPALGMPLAQTKCDGCLKCAEVCPTGAIMKKPGATA